MEMRHLRYFVALAEEKNFRRAAERLGIAQPPLSRQIRGLESELGCRLAVRTPRGVELTPAGRAFLEQARVTLVEAQRAIDQARVAAPEAAERLVLGCEAAADMAIVGRALARLARSHPTMRIELHEQPPAETLRALRAGVTQAVVIALPPSDPMPDVTIERIADVPLCLAVATGHRLAGPQPVSWRRLGDAPFVMFAREAAPALHDTIVTTFREVGVVLRPRHRATDLASALTLVAAGLGVTVVPSGWHPPRSFGLTCRPLRPPATSLAFAVAYRRDASTPFITRFVEAARAVTAVITATARTRARTREVAS